MRVVSSHKLADREAIFLRSIQSTHVHIEGTVGADGNLRKVGCHMLSLDSDINRNVGFFHFYIFIFKQEDSKMVVFN